MQNAGILLRAVVQCSGSVNINQSSLLKGLIRAVLFLQKAVPLVIMSYDPKFKWSCDSSGLGRDNLGPSHSNIVLREKFFSMKEWTNISCSSRAFSVV